jgi:hypothetical protein
MINTLDRIGNSLQADSTIPVVREIGRCHLKNFSIFYGDINPATAHAIRRTNRSNFIVNLYLHSIFSFNTKSQPPQRAAAHQCRGPKADKRVWWILIKEGGFDMGEKKKDRALMKVR